MFLPYRINLLEIFIIWMEVIMEFMDELPEDISEMITSMSTGLMFYTIIKKIDEMSNNEYISFIIKDEQYRIDKIQKSPKFEIKFVVNDVNKILVVDTLIKFEDIDDWLYETFVNIRSKNLGAEALEKLAESKFIYFMIFNENNKLQRIIRTPNASQKNFKRFKLIATEWFDWSMDDFDKAKDSFVKKNSDVFKLWDDIKT